MVTQLSKMSDVMWRRHANPWSVWTRLLSTPLIYLPFWNHSWKQGLVVAIWFVINPFLFPEPKNKESWGARAIRGEARWAKQHPQDTALAVQSVGTIAALGGLYAASRHRLALTVTSAVTVMLCNAWFLDHMAKTYGAAPERDAWV